jgi:mono/diheme cytochrome c family protein
MSPVRPLVLAGLTLAFFGPPLSADEPAKSGPVSYYRDVRPIFVQHCQGCHQPARPQGSYVMTSFAALFKKGDKDMDPVVAGKPADSLLIEQITPDKEGKAEMPKGKDPLSAKDRALVSKWIEEGARDDTPPTARKVVDAAHPPVYAVAPVISALAYSPDGALLAVSGYHEVLLHKADGGEMVGRLVGLSERVQSLAFSPDGKFLAVAGGSPGRFGEVQIWEVARKRLHLSATVTFDTLYGVSWSPDGTKVAFGCSDFSVRAIDADVGNEVLFQKSHTDWVLGTVFSKDSRFVASVSRDRSVRLTEVATQRFIDNITSITPGALKGGLQAIARNPVKSDAKVKPADKGVDTSDRFYDELLIAGADGTPKLYKMHREKKRVIGDDFNFIRAYPALTGRVNSLCFNPDGSQFVAGSSLDGQGEVRVYSTADAKVVSNLEKQPGPIYSVAWSPDGKTIASGGFDGTVRLSDPATGKIVKEFVPVPITDKQAKAP